MTKNTDSYNFIKGLLMYLLKECLLFPSGPRQSKFKFPSFLTHNIFLLEENLISNRPFQWKI